MKCSDVKSLPCNYRNQKKSWMDCTIFSDRLLNLDAEMARKKRKILILVDNCPAHPEVPDLKAIELIFLPPNTTSKLQLMDQGVIRSLKAYYRLALVRKIIHSYDNEHCPHSRCNVYDNICLERCETRHDH